MKLNQQTTINIDIFEIAKSPKIPWLFFLLVVGYHIYTQFFFVLTKFITFIHNLLSVQNLFFFYAYHILWRSCKNLLTIIPWANISSIEVLCYLPFSCFCTSIKIILVKPLFVVSVPNHHRSLLSSLFFYNTSYFVRIISFFFHSVFVRLDHMNYVF